MKYIDVDIETSGFERAIAFQITKQDQMCAATINGIGGTYRASNGWTIKILDKPELNIANKTIFLRGNDVDSDLRIDRTWDLTSNREAENIKYAVEEALAEFDHFIGVCITMLPTPFANLMFGEIVVDAKPAPSKPAGGNVADKPEVSA